MLQVQYFILFQNVIVKMNLLYFDIDNYYDNVSEITFFTNLTVSVAGVLKNSCQIVSCSSIALRSFISEK